MFRNTNGILLSRFAKDLKAAGLQRINVSLDALSPERYAEITGGGKVEEVLSGIEAAKAVGLTPVKSNCVINESPQEPDAREVAAYGQRDGLEVRFIRRMDLTAGHFWAVEGGEGGHCESCNRLRLSSEGFLRPCLLSDIKINIREMLAEEAIRRAIEVKPASGSKSDQNRMHAIGG